MISHKLAQNFRRIDPWNVEHGLEWYSTAHESAEKLSNEFQLDLPRIVAIIAVLSPGCKWDRNLEDARVILEKGEDAVVTTYYANKRKAVSILTAKNFLQYIGGNKVKSFFDNILSPASSCAVTLDRHMLRFILNTKDDKQISKVFASRNKYSFYSEEFRRCALKRNIRPCQLQAMLWLQLR